MKVGILPEDQVTFLTTEEAILAIERGEHADVPSPEADEVLLFLLRQGKIRAGRTKTGQLAFQAKLA